MRVQPWCDSAEQFAALRDLCLDQNGERSVKAISRPHKNIVLMRIQGIDTFQAAEALRGAMLYVHRDFLKLPEGRHFICDLIGCRAVDADSGEEYGKIVDVSFTGANDVYHMKMNDREILIPVIPDIVAQVDVDAGIIKIRPMGGLFDE